MNILPRPDLILAAAVYVAACVPSVAAGAEHMCVVNLSSGLFPNVEQDYPIGIGTRIAILPDSPYPVIYEAAVDRDTYDPRGRIWTLADSGQLASMPGPFPADAFEQELLVEAHSGRVIGIYHLTLKEVFDIHDGAELPTILYEYDRSDGSFTPLRLDGIDEIGSVFFATYIPRMRGSILRGTGGLFLIIDDKVERLDWLEEDVVRDLSTINDLPKHEALAFVTYDGEVVIRLDNGQVHRIDGLPIDGEPAGDIHGETSWIDEIVTTPGLIAQTHNSLFLIPMQPSGDGFLPGKAELLTGPRIEGSYVYGRFRTEVDQYLVYNSTSTSAAGDENALYRLEADGLVPIKGGTIANIGARVLFISAVQSRSQLFLAGNGSIFIHDGTQSLRRMPESDLSEIGDLAKVLDLPTVDLVVAFSEFGLFRITDDNRLLLISRDVRRERSQGGLIVEMPQSDIAVIISVQGVFALDRSGTVTPIEGGDRVRVGHTGWMSDWDAGLIPGRDELMFFAEDNIFLVVDRRISGEDACVDRAIPEQ